MPQIGKLPHDIQHPALHLAVARLYRCRGKVVGGVRIAGERLALLEPSDFDFVMECLIVANDQLQQLEKIAVCREMERVLKLQIGAVPTREKNFGWLHGILVWLGVRKGGAR